MSEQLTILQSALAGRYAIERELGRGGMAVVYLARDERQGRRVAIKVLNPDLSVAVGAERFQREIAIGSSLTHPHIVPLYESGEAGNSLYYVMPYIEGETLRARLDREKQLPLEDAIRIACEVASALDYAHRHGVIHRDVKPANILLEDGHAVIADFGIARALGRATGEHTLTVTGVTLGTPSYMSPEQASAEKEIDGRSDIYALGCVVYEMLAGQPPFTGPNPQAVMARHAMDTAPGIRVVRPIVPPEVEAAIFCAMAKSPADRFATAQEFADALTGTGGMGSTLRYTARWAAQAQRKRRTKWVLAVLLGILVPAGVVGGWVTFTGTKVPTGDLPFSEVAVLYFGDESRDRSLGHIADGLTESLIHELRRFSVRVRSPAVVAPYRGTTIRVDSMAKQVEAGSIITGTVGFANDTVIRVGVHLLDGNSGVSIARAGFELPASRLLEATDSLVQEVATLLREKLRQPVETEKALAEASSVESWLQFQRALRMRKDAGMLARADSIAAAERLLASADSLLAVVEAMDPRWAAPSIARAELAMNSGTRARDNATRRRMFELGLAHVARALERDPRSAHALEVRGGLRFRFHFFDLVVDAEERKQLLDSAEADLESATDLDPSRASAWNTLSMIRVRQFDPQGAYLAAERAWRADAYLTEAVDILFRLYSLASDLGQESRMESWCSEGRRRFPDQWEFHECRLWLMAMPHVSVRPSQIPEVWGILDSIRTRVPASTWERLERQLRMLAAVPIFKAGLADSAYRVIESARSGAIDPEGELAGREAVVRALIGDKDRAIEVLSRFLLANPGHRDGLLKRNTWHWTSLLNDPRFQALATH